MKKKKIIKLSSLALATCALIVMVATMSFGTINASAKPIELNYAKIQYNYANYGGYWSGYYAVGEITLQNINPTKEVTIHYTYNSKDWFDIAATYVKTTKEGNDIWKFKTPETSPSYHYYKFPCRFAIKYKVDGKEYWDNNGGKDYNICSTNVPIDVYENNVPYILQNSNVVLDQASKFGTSEKFDGASVSILLKNLSTKKDVKIRYSSDNWETVKEATAEFSEGFSNKVELWRCNMGQLSKTEPVKFAISYTVNGETYWDNNNGSDYTLKDIIK